MKGRSAVTTTHAILQDLIKEGIINVHKKNLQTHLLTINEQNQFNWIIKHLSEIEDFIDRCYKITKKLDVFVKKKGDTISKRSELQYVLLLQKFVGPIDSMLHGMLYRSIITIKSEKDAQLLNRKILNLIGKSHDIAYQVRLHSSSDLADRLNWESQFTERALNSGIDKITSDIQALKRLSSKENLTLIPEYDKLTNDFKHMAESFMEEFNSSVKPKR
jgi:hypothetical protein